MLMIIGVPLSGKTSLSSSLAACRPRIITATTHSTTAARPAFIAALPLALYPLPPPPLAPHSLPPPLSSHMHCRHRRRPLLALIAAADARPVFIATVADSIPHSLFPPIHRRYLIPHSLPPLARPFTAARHLLLPLLEDIEQKGE